MDDKRKIILNRIKCDNCGDIIISESTHDFRYCNCKGIAVDGGKEYLRRVSGRPGVNYTEMSLYDDSPFEEIRRHIKWGTFGKSGKEPLKMVILKDMTNEHMVNILRNIKPSAIEPIRDLLVQELDYRKQNNIVIEG